MSGNQIYCGTQDNFDEELTINLKKILHVIWSRKFLIIRVFALVLAFFVFLTFVLPKKYRVSADIYINKSNSTNMAEINPYIIDEAGGAQIALGNDKLINNEIELMKSSLVLDKVIRENGLKYQKGKKQGEYLAAKAFYGKGKKLKIENTKNTNVITISYVSTKPELSYGVVSSLITNYIELHKELNSEKSKSDKKLIEEEYAKASAGLKKKLSQAGGLPAQSVGGVGNLSAMSAFSKSARQAMGALKSEYLEGTKSQIAVEEEAQKVNMLAQKLQWATMVEDMSNSSKVLVISEPLLPKPFENFSPKLIMNLLLGGVFGFVFALLAIIIAEIADSKLTYSMLSDNIIFDVKNNILKLKSEILGCMPKNVLLVSFCEDCISDKLNNLANVEIAYADVSEDFARKVVCADKIILVSKIGKTNAQDYKTIRSIIEKQNKEILADALL